MFCAAIPAAAAAGTALNTRQAQRLRHADALSQPGAAARPILKITAGIIVVLLAGSIIYHSLRFGL